MAVPRIATLGCMDNERELCILAMATSLIALFGGSASRIAASQRSNADVGHGSGILWYEVSAAIDVELPLVDQSARHHQSHEERVEIRTLRRS